MGAGGVCARVKIKGNIARRGLPRRNGEVMGGSCRIGGIRREGQQAVAPARNKPERQVAGRRGVGECDLDVLAGAGFGNGDRRVPREFHNVVVGGNGDVVRRRAAVEHPFVVRIDVFERDGNRFGGLGVGGIGIGDVEDDGGDVRAVGDLNRPAVGRNLVCG